MDLLSLRLTAIRYEAAGIHSFDLRRPDDGPLPPFTPGAHIDLHLPGGLVRSYSLCNDCTETHRYVVGVNREGNGRGGSAYVHDSLRVGDSVTVAAPRNNFELNVEADETLLIAGGIGITPLICMIKRLEGLQKKWTLHYCAASHARAAFLEDLRALIATSKRGSLHLHFDDQNQGQFLDLDAIVSAAPSNCHFYCCGPVRMLESFEAATTGRPGEQVHVEYFAAKEAASTQGGFQVVLKRSEKTLAVPPGKTILDVMLEAGVDVPYSCLQGVCSTCETSVLAGVPDHRDLVLTKEERDSNTVMMVCCSGSKTPVLELDR